MRTAWESFIRNTVQNTGCTQRSGEITVYFQYSTMQSTSTAVTVRKSLERNCFLAERSETESWILKIFTDIDNRKYLKAEYLSESSTIQSDQEILLSTKEKDMLPRAFRTLARIWKSVKKRYLSERSVSTITQADTSDRWYRKEWRFIPRLRFA